MRNRIFKARTKGVGVFTTEEAIEWGVTGPICAPAASSGTSARSSLIPVTSSSNSIFPPATHGDCYDRAVVRVEEMRQSLRIIEQCVNNMPEGTI